MKSFGPSSDGSDLAQTATEDRLLEARGGPPTASVVRPESEGMGASRAAPRGAEFCGGGPPSDGISSEAPRDSAEMWRRRRQTAR